VRTATIGRILLGLGALVGIAASVGLLIGFEPARLPAALLNIAAYKLTALAAVGLLAGGAVILRRAGREQSGEPLGVASPASARLEEGMPLRESARDVRTRERDSRPR